MATQCVTGSGSWHGHGISRTRQQTAANTGGEERSEGRRNSSSGGSPHSGPYTEGGSKAGEALYEEIEQVLRTCPSANRTHPRRLEQSVLSDLLRLCGSGTLGAETMAWGNSSITAYKLHWAGRVANLLSWASVMNPFQSSQRYGCQVFMLHYKQN